MIQCGMSDRKYILHLTENQARVIVKALDLYSRIGMGQLGEIAYVLMNYSKSSSDNEIQDRADRFHVLRERLDIISQSWMGRSGHYGISSEKISDVFRIAWDIQQVVRHRLAWDRNPKGDITVDFDDPLKYSSEQLPTIKLEE
jgi:hypothetical protein